jgi:hypothetical protein
LGHEDRAGGLSASRVLSSLPIGLSLFLSAASRKILFVHLELLLGVFGVGQTKLMREASFFLRQCHLA